MEVEPIQPEVGAVAEANVENYCDLCMKKFSSVRSLRRHMKNKHDLEI